MMVTSEYKANVSLKNLISFFINFCIYVHMHVRWQGKRQRLYFFPLSIPNKWARELYPGGWAKSKLICYSSQICILCVSHQLLGGSNMSY